MGHLFAIHLQCFIDAFESVGNLLIDDVLFFHQTSQAYHFVPCIVLHKITQFMFSCHM
jgi:hypothetical protein